MQLKAALKKGFKIWLYLCTAMLFVLLTEGLLFLRIVFKEEPIRKADAVVVFNGIEKRVDAGCELAAAGYAPFVIISTASARRLHAYRDKYRVPPSVAFIREDAARTTFENAYQVGRIIRVQKFKSIILVTSRYHLPRSFLMMKAVLAGQDVGVQLYWPRADSENFWRLTGGSGHLRDEMLRFWGSLAELVYCRISGGVPQANPKEVPVIRRIKSLLAI